MAAETALRPILANGTAMSAHRPNVHTMGDGPARWFRRNRRVRWAASGSAAPPTSLELRRIRCRRERWTRRPPPAGSGLLRDRRAGRNHRTCMRGVFDDVGGHGCPLRIARSGHPWPPTSSNARPPLDPNRNHPDSRWLPNGTPRNLICTFHRLRGRLILNIMPTL